MPDNETRRMTTDEIALMREIVWWRRLVTGERPYVEYYQRRWHSGWRDESREIAFELPKVDDPEDAYAIVYYCTGQYASYTKFEARTLTEAVDVLCAFGYLPARFSTAYRMGYNACMLAHRIARQSHPGGGVRGWADPDVFALLPAVNHNLAVRA